MDNNGILHRIQHTYQLIRDGGDLIELAKSDPIVASMTMSDLKVIGRMLHEDIEREKAEKRAIEMLMIKRSWDLDDAADGQNR